MRAAWLIVLLGIAACGRTTKAPAETAKTRQEAAKPGPQGSPPPSRAVTNAAETQADQVMAAPSTPSPIPALGARQPWLGPWLRQAGVRLAVSRAPSPRLVSRRRGAKGTAALRLGRQGLWLYGRRLVRLRCRRRGGRGCGSRRTGLEMLTYRPQDLGAATAEGPSLVPLLAKACRHLKGREILVLADRDLQVGALMQTLATLREIGARPQLAAADKTGVVAVWPANAPRDSRLPRRVIPGERVPADVQGLTLELSTTHVSVILQRRAGGYMRRPLQAPAWKAVALWAARLAAKKPPVDLALLVVSPDVSVRRLVRAVEALMAPCQTDGCAKPTRRLVAWQLIQLEAGAGADEVDPPEMPKTILQPSTTPHTLGRVPTLLRGGVGRPGRPSLRGHRVDLSRRPDAPQARLNERPRRAHHSGSRRSPGSTP